jgi:hypothetical protein
MAVARQLVELGHSAREAAHIKLKQPLSSMTYMAEDSLPDDVLELVRAEVNVLQITYEHSAGDMQVELDANLTDELLEMGNAREVIRAIQAERKKSGVKLDDRITVTLPDWPASQETEIKRQTLAAELRKGDELSIRLADR